MDRPRAGGTYADALTFSSKVMAMALQQQTPWPAQEEAGGKDREMPRIGRPNRSIR
jgi:hypothetical protein